MRNRAVGPAQGETGGAIELYLGGGLDVGKVKRHRASVAQAGLWG